MISPKKYAKAAKVSPNGFKTTNEFFNYVFKDEEMIWMGQNTNHLHDHSEIAEAMIDCINEGNYCKYPPPEGFPELKELVVRDLGLGDGFEALITAGGTESLYLCMNDILEPEDNAITCDPGYLIIDNFASRFACSVISIPIYSRECGYKLTPELVLENMDRNTHMVSLIDPLNPLGSSYTKDEIKAFADIANDHDIYLLHDITYRDFAMDHHLAADYAPEKTVTVYSFSKIYGMAGLRIGAIVATSDLIESIKSIVINDLGTNVISQAGAIAALRSKNRWVDRIRNTTFRNQKIIKDAVDEVDGAFIPVYPSSGNMMAIDIHKTGVDPLDLADYLLKRKIFVRQGAYTSRAFGDRYIRLSFSIPREQVEIFAENFVDVMEFLRPSN
ncbi:pyridoxal phosphate-dependent aminotransferase [Methanothermobacter wolfeii]|uniref:Aminotransferase n=1 Tax=Methanothermobacter wolfeii TaxID=145261 RepID=A0A9E7UNC3_METWO|nr:pyridoxal phosphate-dependent aminotransferase [Methanothermobacter wolfeii]NLM02661.1 pyridoxal phosphate-dependent aminotransferase [Methanothermobacter wolfeii]UXH31956.1 pyridoxal phosphate-dependent aminotransferase [Methanothermobacter wolfeii]